MILHMIAFSQAYCPNNHKMKHLMCVYTYLSVTIMLWNLLWMFYDFFARLRFVSMFCSKQFDSVKALKFKHLLLFLLILAELTTIILYHYVVCFFQIQISCLRPIDFGCAPCHHLDVTFQLDGFPNITHLIVPARSLFNYVCVPSAVPLVLGKERNQSHF